MKTSQVVAAILAMSLDDFSVIQEVTSYKASQLQTSGQETVKSSYMEKLGQELIKECPALAPKKPGRPTKYDAKILELIRQNPGINGSVIRSQGNIPVDAFVVTTKRLRSQGKIKREGCNRNARWFLT